MQRYVEFQGQLQRIIGVVKVRGSAHSKDLRAFEITEDGLVLGEALGRYEGLLTGSPDLPRRRWSEAHNRITRRRTQPESRSK